MLDILGIVNSEVAQTRALLAKRIEKTILKERGITTSFQGLGICLGVAVSMVPGGQNGTLQPTTGSLQNWRRRLTIPPSRSLHSCCFFPGPNDQSQIAVRLRDSSSRKRTKEEMTGSPRATKYSQHKELRERSLGGRCALSQL
jgi:hypothetical protein